MKRWLAALCIGFASATHGAGLSPWQIDIDQSQVEREVAKRFPFKLQWLGAFDVSVGAPRLRLRPETNRVAADVEIGMDDRLFLQHLRGSLSVEGGLRYQASDATLRYVDVRVMQVSIRGLPDAYAGEANRLGSLVTEQLLEGAVLYTLTEQQKAWLRVTGVQPGELRVTKEGFSIALEPAGAGR